MKTCFNHRSKYDDCLVLPINIELIASILQWIILISLSVLEE